MSNRKIEFGGVLMADREEVPRLNIINALAWLIWKNRPDSYQ